MPTGVVRGINQGTGLGAAAFCDVGLHASRVIGLWEAHETTTQYCMEGFHTGQEPCTNYLI